MNDTTPFTFTTTTPPLSPPVVIRLPQRDLIEPFSIGGGGMVLHQPDARFIRFLSLVQQHKLKDPTVALNDHKNVCFEWCYSPDCGVSMEICDFGSVNCTVFCGGYMNVEHFNVYDREIPSAVVVAIETIIADNEKA